MKNKFLNLIKEGLATYFIEDIENSVGLIELFKKEGIDCEIKILTNNPGGYLMYDKDFKKFVITQTKNEDQYILEGPQDNLIFQNHYKPFTDQFDDFLIEDQKDPRIKGAKIDKRLWSVVELSQDAFEPEVKILYGHHTKNVIGYVIASVPAKKAEETEEYNY